MFFMGHSVFNSTACTVVLVVDALCAAGRSTLMAADDESEHEQTDHVMIQSDDTVTETSQLTVLPSTDTCNSLLSPNYSVFQFTWFTTPNPVTGIHFNFFQFWSSTYL